MLSVYSKCRGYSYQPFYFTHDYYTIRGPGSSVGIATGYGMNGPGIESQWERDLPHLSRPVQLVPGLSGGKERPRRDADPSPPSSAVVMKG